MPANTTTFPTFTERLKVRNDYTKARLTTAPGIGLHLVACSGQKLDTAAPAKELYQGQLFRKQRAFLEAHGYEWRILSALHGLVHPEQELEPYDYRFRSKAERREWAALVDIQLVNTLLEQTAPGDTVWLWAGREYREFLRPWIESHGRVAFAPLAGMGIGEQLKCMNAKLSGLGLGGAA